MALPEMRFLLIPVSFLLAAGVIFPSAGPFETADTWLVAVQKQSQKQLQKRRSAAEDMMTIASLSDSKSASEILAAAAAPASPLPQPASSGGPVSMERPKAAGDWAIGDLLVESSTATSEGFVEYRLRGILRANPGAKGGAVAAAAKSSSSEIAVVSREIHFAVRPGDDLDALSRDSIVVRVPGGMSFEPSMLRWTFQSEQ